MLNIDSYRRRCGARSTIGRHESIRDRFRARAIRIATTLSITIIIIIIIIVIIVIVSTNVLDIARLASIVDMLDACVAEARAAVDEADGVGAASRAEPHEECAWLAST
jgi:hypothetical protein